MNAFNNGDLEIVGFNGAPLVECGRALAVARRKSDGMHCVLTSTEDVTAISWYDEDEAAAFAKARRWTRFRHPLPLPRLYLPGADGPPALQPMVVYAAQDFLDTAARVSWPAAFNGESFLWRHLEGNDDSIQAACGSAEVVEAILDDWATSLKGRFNVMCRLGRDQASLKRVADFMLCAARNRPLRWQAYLRYALAQEPERVRQIYDAFTRNEFPDVPWQAYLEQIKNLGDVLKCVPAQEPQTTAPSSTVPARRKLSGIATCQPLDVQVRPAA